MQLIQLYCINLYAVYYAVYCTVAHIYAITATAISEPRIFRNGMIQKFVNVNIREIASVQYSYWYCIWYCNVYTVLRLYSA
jgi:hypothetical protein